MRILSEIKTVTKTTVRPSFKKGTILAILGNNIKSTSKVIEIVLIEQNEPEATMRIMINVNNRYDFRFSFRTTM